MGKAGTIEIRDGKFWIDAPPHISIRLRRNFGGAQRFKAGRFNISLTAENAFDLEWFRSRYPALEITPGSEAQYRKLIADFEKRLAGLAEIEETGYVPRQFELAIPARDYQRLAADMAIRSGELLVGDEVGLGKTVTAICALTAPGVLPALVITMTHLTRQWEVMLKRFAPALRVHRIRKGKPYQFTEIKTEVDPITKRRKVVKNSGVPDVILINYHKLHGWVENLAGLCKTVIIDEAQEFRHSGTKKYDAGRAIAQEAELRMGLTATPIYNYGAEIHAVMDVIAPGQLGTFKEFSDEWCGGATGAGGFGGQDPSKVSVSDPAALGAYLRSSGLMIRRTRKDVGRELPALTVVRHSVEADPESISKARADVAELARRVLDRIGTPQEQMQAAGELDYRMRQATGIAKAGAVADLVRLIVDSGKKVVLFGWHHEVYRLWAQDFERVNAEIPYAMYTGAQSDAQKDESRRRFVDGDAKILIISLRAGAGLDGLQHVCCDGVIGELDWSPAVIHQDVGRLHRDGQTQPVMIYIPVADEGSDPTISDVLGFKEAQSTGILDPSKNTSEPIAAGAATDHMRRLAQDVLNRAKENR